MSKYISKAKFHEIAYFSVVYSVGNFSGWISLNLREDLDYELTTAIASSVLLFASISVAWISYEMIKNWFSIKFKSTGFFREMALNKVKTAAVLAQIILALAMVFASVTSAPPDTFLWLAMAQLPAMIVVFSTKTVEGEAS